MTSHAENDLSAVVAWPGTVLSFGSSASARAAAMLAAATSRPHRHVEGARIRAEVAAAAAPVAVVATSQDVAELGDWPLPPEAGTDALPAGLVTARGADRLVDLVRRTLAAPSHDRAPVRRIVHPAFPFAGDREHDATELAELRQLVDADTGLLLVQTHGRECCAHLPDAVVCGRSDGFRPVSYLPAVNLASCQQGTGCIRRDLDDTARVEARSIAGLLTVLQACSSVASGAHTLAPELNLALGVLDGAAVAVIGALGRHTAELAAMDELHRLAVSGLNLGEIVATLNQRAMLKQGSLGRLVLLGDPALVPVAWLDPAEIPELGEAVQAWDRADETSEAAVALRRHADEVLPAIDALRWIDVAVDDELLGAARTAQVDAWTAMLDKPEVGAAAAATAEDAMLAVQQRLVDTLVSTIRDTWWQFGGLPSALRESGARPFTCPECGRSSGSVIDYRHRLTTAVVVQLTVCPYCGPICWRSGTSVPLVTHKAPNRVTGHIGGAVPFSVTLENRAGRALVGAVGTALVAGEYLGLPAVTSRPLRLTAGTTLELDLALDCTAPDLLADQYEVATVWCLDGQLTVTLSQLWLTAPN